MTGTQFLHKNCPLLGAGLRSVLFEPASLYESVRGRSVKCNVRRAQVAYTSVSTLRPVRGQCYFATNITN